MCPNDDTLLEHLLYWGYDPEDYLDMLDDIQTSIEDKEYLDKHPEEASEDAQYIDDDIECWEEQLLDMRAGWNPKQKPNMEKELELIKKWVREQNRNN